MSKPFVKPKYKFEQLENGTHDVESSPNINKQSTPHTAMDALLLWKRFHQSIIRQTELS